MYIINSKKKSCRTPIWGVVPPIPELTSGRKIKGTETRGHTMKEIGTSLMTGQKRLHNACHNSWAHAWLLCGGTSRLGLYGHWVAAQGMRTKALPTLLLLLSFLRLPPSCFFPNHTTHTHTHTHTENDCKQRLPVSIAHKFNFTHSYAWS